jgi:pimeloyl-ACP methyl ester carboxylesterase
MDGTGILFKEFIRLLPDDVDTRVVRYPDDEFLTYEQLAERVVRAVPVGQPYLIIAESFSGPVAALLAAQPVGDLRAVVFVSSFVSFPGGRMGTYIAKLFPAALFRFPAPAWLLRWLLMDSAAAPDAISDVQAAIARIRPEVLAGRLRDALNADFSESLRDCTVRVVYLVAGSDRLLGTRGLRGILAMKPNVETVRIAGPHLLLQCAPYDCLAALRKLGLFRSPLPECQ